MNANSEKEGRRLDHLQQIEETLKWTLTESRGSWSSVEVNEKHSTYVLRHSLGFWMATIAGDLRFGWGARTTETVIVNGLRLEFNERVRELNQERQLEKLAKGIGIEDYEIIELLKGNPNHILGPDEIEMIKNCQNETEVAWKERSGAR